MPDITVDLYAWPSDKVLKGLKAEETVPRKLIATATSNSAGKFSLSVSKETLSASAVSSGNANLEADAGTASWFFTVNTKNPVITSIHLTGLAGPESPERAITWSTGFSIGVVGFGGQAQTGYDTSAQISITFNANRELCGTNAIPAKAALLVVKK
jgi:hypothetical protein